MALAPTPENFRAELARHCLTRKCVADHIGMNLSMLGEFVAGTRALQGWAAHNIALGINQVTELRLFDVDETLGILPSPPRGRPPGYTNPSTVDPLRRPADKWRRARRAS